MFAAQVVDIAKHPMKYEFFAIAILRAIRCVNKIICAHAMIFLQMHARRRHLHRCKIFFTIQRANGVRGPESIKNERISAE
jgi:hypothetical protein